MVATHIPGTASTRLDKRVAELLQCSRADAQKYVEGGWVRVDGEVIEECQVQISTQQVTVDDDAQLEDVEPATMLLHKPAGVELAATAKLITPATHASGDISGVRPLKRHFHRLNPLMPLDVDASGLVVLSQDGRVWRRLTEDYFSIEQEFVVEVSGEIAAYGLARLEQGMTYRGRLLPRAKVSWQNEIRLRFAIKEVQPGQLRYMCGEVGLTVVAIRRLRIGRVALGKMAVGEWRYQPVSERF